MYINPTQNLVSILCTYHPFGENSKEKDIWEDISFSFYLMKVDWYPYRRVIISQYCSENFSNVAFTLSRRQYFDWLENSFGRERYWTLIYLVIEPTTKNYLLIVRVYLNRQIWLCERYKYEKIENYNSTNVAFFGRHITQNGRNILVLTNCWTPTLSEIYNC